MKFTGLTLEDAARMGAEIGPPVIIPEPRPKARGRTRHVPGQMNKTEAAYWDYLQARLRAGEIVWAAFEPWKLKLAPRTFYSPDFTIMLPDGTIELHEIKGFMEDDAAVKIKIAREMFWMFRVRAFRKKGGNWVEIMAERD